MEKDAATRAATEAANQTATGFFPGIGFAAGVGALGILGALFFHPFLLLAGAVSGGIAAYKWRLRRRPPKRTDLITQYPDHSSKS